MFYQACILRYENENCDLVKECCDPKHAHLSHNLELMIQSVINNKSNSSTTARQDSSYLGIVLEEAPISITINY